MKLLELPQGKWSYSDTKPLGTPGGFAAVYPGMSESGEPVAVKVFHTSDPESSKRELAFAKSRMSISSDHMIPILGFGVDKQSGHAHIVMARAEFSLHQKLVDGGPLDEPAAVSAAHSMVKGLLSVSDWIHRDLKPANVLWAESRWQLTDFGIARLAAAVTAQSTMKEFLSAPYAAPEQWNGERATSKADVYSLGCVIFEMVSGTPPFVGPTVEDYASQHRRSTANLQTGSSELRTLVSLMLSKSPDGRPTLHDLDERFSKWGLARNSTPAASALAAAATDVAIQSAQSEAAAVNKDSAQRARLVLRSDALRELDEISKELFEKILSAAPNADFGIGREHPHPMRRVQLGSGNLTLSIGQYSDISEGAFFNCGWDVVCGDFIKVGQADGRGRSASLWFMRRGNEPFEWQEVSYWSWGRQGTSEPQPCYLPPAQDADFAAANVTHTWSLAHPPRSLRGSGRDAFFDRWIQHFTATVQGRFQSPSSLPEER